MRKRYINIHEIRKIRKYKYENSVYKLFRREAKRGNPPPLPRFPDARFKMWDRVEMIRWLSKIS